MVGDNILISIINILINNIANMVIILTIQTCSIRRIGRAVLIIVTASLVLGACRTTLRCVPRVPLVRVVDVIRQNVAGIVADIVRRTEDIVDVHILISRDMMYVRCYVGIGFLQFLCRSGVFQCFVFTRQ